MLAHWYEYQCGEEFKQSSTHRCVEIDCSHSSSPAHEQRVERHNHRCVNIHQRVSSEPVTQARRTYSITNASSIFGHSCSIRNNIFPSSKGVAPAATGFSTTIIKATTAEAIGATATTPICSSTGSTSRIVIILIVDQAATIIDDSVSTGIIDDPCRSCGGHRRCGDVDNNWWRRLPHFDNAWSSSIWCLNVGDRCWLSN